MKEGAGKIVSPIQAVKDDLHSRLMALASDCNWVKGYWYLQAGERWQLI